MARTTLFVWEGKEHEDLNKSADWYWALGIVATAAIIACVLFGEYLLAFLVFTAAAVVAVRVAKKPPVHRFELNDQGLLIGSELHPYSRMISFAVLEDIEEQFPPVLSIKTENLLAPHLVIPLEGVNADAVYTLFLQRVEEGTDHHHHQFSDILAALIGF